jgi:glycosyltransferase involved in cell wall biosynthesis
MTQPGLRGERFLVVADYALDYLGGAQSAMLQQAAALAGAGASVTLVAPRPEAVRERMRSVGVSVITPPSRVTLPLIDLPVFLAGPELADWVERLLDRRAPTAVILHSELGLAAAILSGARERGIPALHTVHTFFWRGPAALGAAAPMVRAFHARATGLARAPGGLAPRPLDSALRGMTWSMARAADRVLSPSAHQAAALSAAGIDGVELVSNATTPATTESAPVSGALRLVWAGRFAPEKRLDVAIDAVTRIGPRRVHLHVAGGRGRSRPGITFHGRLSPDGVGRLLAVSHGALISSDGFDNQPMIALEAFAHGRPVVVCDRRLAVEFGAAAIGAADPSAGGLAAAILALREPDILRRASAAAIERSAQAHPLAHAARIAEVLAEVRSAQTEGVSPSHFSTR